MVDPDRLWAAYETARCDLLAESTNDGHWHGSPSSSALSTATAISALAIVERHAPMHAGRIVDERRECALSELIMTSLRWLAKHQNADGGWGDTDRSPSNLAATLAVRAAFALTCVPANHPGLLERADAYIGSQGGLRGFKRRHAHEPALVAPILAQCALAGLTDWSQVPAQALELAVLPAWLAHWLRPPVALRGLPVFLAVGQARYIHKPPANPLAGIVRGSAIDKSTQLLADLQSKSGGFFETVAWTGQVLMNLAATGRAEHSIVRRGVEFLLAHVRPDGSWPLEPNLSVLRTGEATVALLAAGENPAEFAAIPWLLSRSQAQASPGAGVQPGGWSAGDFPCATAETEPTCLALVALAAQARADVMAGERIAPLAVPAIRWLLELQNADGGWPTAQRGQRASVLDRSASELTALALQTLGAWRALLSGESGLPAAVRQELDTRITLAIDAGLRHLLAVQQRDGSWQPLGWSNPARAAGDAALVGTCIVLTALRDLDRLNSPAPRRALDWLPTQQKADGSFGTLEETALAVDVLLNCGHAQAHEESAARGLRWLVDSVEAGRHMHASPLRLRFARLWYYDRVTPLSACVTALGRAARQLVPRPAVQAVHALKR